MTSEMSLGEPPNPPFTGAMLGLFSKKCKNTRFWTRFFENSTFHPSPTQSVSCRRPLVFPPSFFVFFFDLGCDGESWRYFGVRVGLKTL